MPDYRPAPFDIGNFDLAGALGQGSRLAEILGQRAPVGSLLQERKAREMASGEAEKNRQFQSAEAEKARQFEAGQAEKTALRTKEDFLNKMKDEMEMVTRAGGDPQLVLQAYRAELEGKSEEANRIRKQAGLMEAETEKTKEETKQIPKTAEQEAELRAAQIEKMRLDVSLAKTEEERAAVRQKYWVQQADEEIIRNGFTTEAAKLSIQKTKQEMAQADEYLSLAREQAKSKQEQDDLNIAEKVYGTDLVAVERAHNQKLRALETQYKMAEEAFQSAFERSGGAYNPFLSNAELEDMDEEDLKVYRETQRIDNARKEAAKALSTALTEKESDTKVASDKLREAIENARKRRAGIAPVSEKAAPKAE